MNNIEWNGLSPAVWEERFAKIRQSNMLQSYAYALGICGLKKQKARWGVIKLNGEEAGLVQILEVGLLKNLIHAVILDRGPLWFDGFGSHQDFEDFLIAFKAQLPKRLGRKIRFIPEYSADIDPILQKHGFKKQGGQPYQTIWLDLTRDIEERRGNLKKNWRNMLARAEKDNIVTHFDFSTDHLKLAIGKYALDKAEKGFDGPSVELLVALSKTFGSQNKILLGRAEKEGNVLGYALFFMHGSSATYQIGWTSAQGRTNGAQNKLLWDSLEALKQKGITDLDLGGVNDETAKGVKKFKEGMGGTLVSFSGLYC